MFHGVIQKNNTGTVFFETRCSLGEGECGDAVGGLKNYRQGGTKFGHFI